MIKTLTVLVLSFLLATNVMSQNAGADQTVCYGEWYQLIGTSPSTGTWTGPAGNPFIQLSSTSGGVAPVKISTTGTFNFIYSANGSSDTMKLTVPPQIMPLFGFANPRCAGAFVLPTTSANGITGKWQPASIDSAATGTSVYYFTSNYGQCAVDGIAMGITVIPNSKLTQSISICATELPYQWNGMSLPASGTYKKTLTNYRGCDSIVTLILSVVQKKTSTQSISICGSSLPYHWNSKTLITSGTYKDTLITAAGCDSIATLILTVNQPKTSSKSITVCASSLPYHWNSKSISVSGIYKDTLTSATGCDSFATLILTITPIIKITDSISILSIDLPYQWHSKALSIAGTYVDTLKTQSGCDSITTLIFKVKPGKASFDTIALCPPSLPYLWNGRSLPFFGIYKDTLITATGLDSVATLFLIRARDIVKYDTITVFSSSIPYQWHGKTLYTQGLYFDTLKTVLGCDSLVVLYFYVRSTNQWIGTTNSTWENASNWSSGFVPNASSDVIINSGTVVINSNTTISSLQLSPGVIFSVNPMFKLVILH